MATNTGRRDVSGSVRRLTVSAVICAVVAGAGYPAAHLYERHQTYGVWTWSPSGATPKLPFHGRTYLIGGPATTITTGALVPIRATPDGEILGPPMAAGTPTSIVLHLRNGISTQYLLSGGP